MERTAKIGALILAFFCKHIFFKILCHVYINIMAGQLYALLGS